VEWLKTNGEKVEKGEPILVMETDKIAIDVEAPVSGILQGICAQAGEQLPIGTVIAYILAPGETLPDDGTPKKEPAKLQDHPLFEGITPVARKMATAGKVDVSKVKGTGAGGRITKQDVEAAIQASTEVAPDRNKVNATPKARKLARQMEIDLSQVGGSGPSGRIQAEDVMAFSSSAKQTGRTSEISRDEWIPLVGIRRTIAERMTTSYQSAPHITFTTRVDMTGFEAARAQLTAEAEANNGGRVSLTALMIKLLALTLCEHPFLNSTLKDDQIILRGDINISVAVALPKGLIAPVVKNADQKNLRQITTEVDDLVLRAREGKLNPGDVKGGTFSLSNLGPFGIEQFTAIIYPGQAGILAVGSMQPEVIPVDGEPQIRPILHMTLSVDHRIVDGAIAAQFMADLKSKLEAPIMALW
jgi:pyruvate dehydrogenase E2 component (dihydrolipoamide acetyltransferase)